MLGTWNAQFKYRRDESRRRRHRVSAPRNARYHDFLMSMPESAAAFVNGQIERLHHVKPKRRIVFPEGGDARVRAAADRLRAEGLVEPILLKPGAAMPDQDA